MIELYDTTLRDGTQSEEISFTVADKIRIAERLDDLGIHYIEGGWPGSNPRDDEFFAAFRQTALTHAKLAAFGSTRHRDTPTEKDRNLFSFWVKVSGYYDVFRQLEPPS